ncbi:kinase-like domain-containing protein [Glomus cerebriforme]|uniref:Kinase-like domain-containing protein n=1 Tax=Glomus cerebriforme TaxID=658196 RepID=A0A397T844_9GLOM|nr:kinase-like domain-containing protein [Glomus cerebriforme]
MSSQDHEIIGRCEKCDEQYLTYYNAEYEWCKPCQIINLKEKFTICRNEKIDNFIQEMQLKINCPTSITFEWIPYDQFIDVKEKGKNNFATVCSATWMDGPLCWNKYNKNYIRDSNRTVALKFLHNFQNITGLSNEIKEYSIINCNVYGISQNPNTKDYIMILNNEYFEIYCVICYKIYTNRKYKWCKLCQINDLRENFTNWTSGNNNIDNFIHEMQLKINRPTNLIFEWIPYDQFSDIKEKYKNNFTTVCLATWKNGPLDYNFDEKKYTRDSNKIVALKYLHKSQNIVNELQKEVKDYSLIRNDKILNIYGISQNPDTKDYIMALHNIEVSEIYCVKCYNIYTNRKYKWCEPCQINNLKENFKNWTSGNDNIDNFIQEMQLKINCPTNIIFEWIPYNQFSNVKEKGKNNFVTVCLASWKGPLYWDKNIMEFIRDSNRTVYLKCLYKSQNIVNELQNIINELQKEVEENSFIRNDKILNIYGISQNPNTKDYIMVLHNEYFETYCVKCYKIYTMVSSKWCKPCQINNLKENFINWTSGNEKIDNFIHEMQLKINNYDDIVIEWILFDQFNDIKEVGEGGFSTVYSAIWKDGPLYYNKFEWNRDSNKTVALKYLQNSQDITNEFLNEVKEYSIIRNSNILNIYGISQNPDTKDYIMVLDYAQGGNFNNWMNENYKYFFWKDKLSALYNIIYGLKELHQKRMIHRDFHTGNILLLRNRVDEFSNCRISDMGLCGEVGNTDKRKIYGVMPYVAPEVLRGKPYTKAADIYSFGMIMYFVATGKQPFANCAHDHHLILNICDGIRPEINEPEAPKYYIDLMNRCWDSNLNNRPNVIEIIECISSFRYIYENNFAMKDMENNEIKKQFEEAEEYRRANLSTIEINKSVTHPQAIYTSRILNSFTNNLPKYDDDNTECLDCGIEQE